jgi:hypothetical protein
MNPGEIGAEFQHRKERGAGFVVVVEVFILGQEAEGVAKCCTCVVSAFFLTDLSRKEVHALPICVRLSRVKY